MVGSAAVVIFMLFVPLAVVIVEEYKIWSSKKQALNDPSPLRIVAEKATTKPKKFPPRLLPRHLQLMKINRPPPQSHHQAPRTPAMYLVGKPLFTPPNRGEDFTILQALFSADMFILFLATICGVGGTLTAIDNLGQIGASLGYPKKSTSTFVSLVSIWNYLGRVVSGFGSEHVLKKYKFPRPLLLTLTLLLSCAGHLLIAFNVPGGLYVASVIIGFCFGAQWPLLFAIISELFGLKYYSTLYNFGAVASPVGLYLLNVRLTGHLYDKEAGKQLAAKGSRKKARRSPRLCRRRVLQAVLHYHHSRDIVWYLCFVNLGAQD
ncbi:putative NODULIN-LIKE PROTEIN [Salix purpurea]|uniref:NODULIN-LIKE PROTEIN n=1 Tax=Salix purpurea TaxID=77065 RepID=A0A9Q0ZAJ0_SALPP|nr:putative NODULIN-LIKE PROTEIN [Salix purpurea]